MQNKKRFTGTGVALVTPFTAKGAVDEVGLEGALQHVLKGGIDFLVMLGSTGEAATLTEEESYRILEQTVEVVAGRVPIVAGFSGNHTQALVKTLEQYHFNGISGILSSTPSYVKPVQKGVFDHFDRVAQACPVPIILYNVPSRTASHLDAETAIRLSEKHTNIVGIKEASGNMAQSMRLVQLNQREDFSFLSGDDETTLPMISFGFDGLVSVVANAFPEATCALVNAARSGEMERARQLHYQLLDVLDPLFAEGNPAGIKSVMELLGICGSSLRLPLVSISDSLKTDLKKQVERLQESLRSASLLT